MEDPETFPEFAKVYPAELQHLFKLGLVREEGNQYETATVLELL